MPPKALGDENDENSDGQLLRYATPSDIRAHAQREIENCSEAIRSWTDDIARTRAERAEWEKLIARIS